MAARQCAWHTSSYCVSLASLAAWAAVKLCLAPTAAGCDGAVFPAAAWPAGTGGPGGAARQHGRHYLRALCDWGVDALSVCGAEHPQQVGRQQPQRSGCGQRMACPWEGLQQVAQRGLRHLLVPCRSEVRREHGVKIFFDMVSAEARAAAAKELALQVGEWQARRAPAEFRQQASSCMQLHPARSASNPAAVASGPFSCTCLLMLAGCGGPLASRGHQCGRQVRCAGHAPRCAL